MTRLAHFMAGLAGIAPSASALCSAGDDDNLLAALGGNDWSEANGLGDWSEANGLGDLSDLADLSGDDEEIGRKIRRVAKRAGMNPAAMFRALAARAMRGGGGGPAFAAALPNLPQGAVMSSIAPGTPQRGERFGYMPFPAGAFVNAGATTIVLRTTSQRPLKTVRIYTEQTRTAAAATAAILVTINEIKIGQEVQPAATGALGFNAFRAEANGLPVSLDPIDVNVPIEVTVVASAAPGVAERIDFAVAFFGYMVK